MSESHEFPIRDFAGRCKSLKWFVTPTPTQNGIYCEACRKKIPFTEGPTSLGAIVGRIPSDDIMKHCPGRVLPCCIPCGLKHGIITQKEVDDLTEERLQQNQTAWEQELSEICHFQSDCLKIVESVVEWRNQAYAQR